VTVLRDGESVASNRVEELNETQLIKLMVGREVSQIFPEPEGKPGEVALSLRNVSCAAAGISNVTFDVRAGEILGLAGLVGAGRTELARVLFGITPADSGDILLKGKKITIGSTKEAIDHGIAYVPEDRRLHGVILEMPIAANITMASHPQLFPGGWLRFDRERDVAQNYIRDLSIKTAGSDSLAGTLSGGNQQKVSVARWLATSPKILILDEPTQGVDVGAKSEIHKIIRQLAARGMAVLMISSDLPEMIGMSDRIAVMRNGAIASILPGKANAHDIMAAAVGAKG
jgi:rhamnose transport system ATP-binding protein